MSRTITILALFLFLFCESVSAYTILVDPGHGGEDDGASNYYLKHKKKRKKRKIFVFEKDIALQLSKRIHRKLKAKKYSSFLSRSIDRTLSLEDRAKMAEKIRADLFISIHVNSSTKKHPRGFETYYLDNHNDNAIKKVEAVENMGLKGDALIINQILTDLVIDRTVKSSKGLAMSIHSEIYRSVGKQFKMKNRGIKPGLFYVLALAKRPAILLEVGFLSNRNELKKLLSSRFQERYANAVVRGIDKYVKANSTQNTSLF